MKRLTLSVALLAIMTFAACADDDSNNSIGTCVTCTYTQQGNPDTQEVCNRNGNAFVDGVDSGAQYSDYIEVMINQGYSCQ